MLKFPDRVKEATATTGTGAFALSGASSGFRSFASGLTLGDTVPYCAVLGAEFEVGVGTLTAASTLARTTVTASSNAGALVNFSAGAKEIFATVSGTQVAGFLTSADGVTVETYLATTPGSSVTGSDTVPTVQGGTLKGVGADQFAAYATGQWASGKTASVAISTTAAIPFDFTTHNRRRLVCTAAANLVGPSNYGNVGDDFTSEVVNISGGVVTFGTGVVCQPSGNTLSTGQRAPVFSFAGTIYVQLPAAGVASVAPGQVTGLTAGAVTSSTQAVTWAAPATGTAPFSYTAQYRVAGSSTWLTAASGISTTSYTYTGFAPSTSYEKQVIAVNGAGPGAASATLTSSTAAGDPVPGQVTNLAAGTPASTSIPLTWTAATGTVTGNTVERSIDGGTTWTQVASNITGTSYSVTGLNAATSYKFRVTAYNASGNGTASSVLTVSTAAAAAVTVTASARSGFPIDKQAYSGSSYFHDLTITGATISAVEFALTESATTYPASDISGSTTPRGDVGACTISGTAWGSSALGIAFTLATPTPFYFWIRVTDSLGGVHYFRRTDPVNWASTMTAVNTTVATNTPAYP